MKMTSIWSIYIFTQILRVACQVAIFKQQGGKQCSKEEQEIEYNAEEQEMNTMQQGVAKQLDVL